MFNIFVCFCLFFSFCFSSVAYEVRGQSFSENSFFSLIPKEEWSSFSLSQKQDLLKNHLYKKLVFLETKQNGFLKDPYFSRKLKNRIDQFLINVAYDVFVAYPLVDSSFFNNSVENTKYDISVSHLLLGYNGCRLPVPIKRSKQNTATYAENLYLELSNGASFDEYVKKFSDDPSVDKNLGNLGWLSWGRTVPEFQKIAFSLSSGEISSPVLTSFGYHIIRLEEKRASQASLLDSLGYIALCTEQAIASVPLNEKRIAAQVYDDEIILKGGLVFNNSSLLKVFNSINTANTKNSIIASGKKNLIKILSSTENTGVLCVFNEKAYGVRWFANHFSRLPATRVPSIKTINDLRKAFKLAVLQQLSLDKINSNLNSFSFLLDSKLEKLSKNLVFDSYLKFIVNNVDDIGKEKIDFYYNENKEDKYVEFNLVEVREIKTLKKTLSDSLFSLLVSGDSFKSIASSFSLTNPRSGGLIDPFVKTRYGPMGKAAFSLDVGSFSSPIENLDGTWSIIFLEQKIDKAFIPLLRVESKIKSLLKKNQQNDTKNHLYDSLFLKFSVKINPSFLSFQN